jgi:uncharacterized protein
MKFMLDTNFMMVPGQFKLDIYEKLREFGNAELYTTSLSLAELVKIADGKGRDAGSARIGLILLKREGVKVIPSEDSNADEAIKRIAVKDSMVVCTADKKLKDVLKKNGVKVMSLRQGRYLEIEKS